MKGRAAAAVIFRRIENNSPANGIIVNVCADSAELIRIPDALVSEPPLPDLPVKSKFPLRTIREGSLDSSDRILNAPEAVDRE